MFSNHGNKLAFLKKNRIYVVVALRKLYFYEQNDFIKNLFGGGEARERSHV